MPRGRPRRNLWDDWVPSGDGPRRLTLVTGVRPFTPRTTCDDVHPHGPIPIGSSCCCAVCHKTGVDHLKLPGEPVGSRLNEGWAATPTKYAPGEAAGANATLKGGRG